MRAVNRFRRPLSLGTLALCLLGTGLQSLGCDDENKPRKRRFTDTEGRIFKATCSAGSCTGLRQTKGPKWPGKKKVALTVSGRYFGVCNSKRGGEPESLGDCRVLVCEKNKDCPHPMGLKTGSCLSGYCAEPSQSFTQQDSVMLCMKGLGLGTSSSDQLAQYATGLNCGEPCKIPSSCAQPWKVGDHRAAY
ncbi:MAG: hypothetical protein HRU17_23980 [Polyangiaceae bacterium]|nr:hypothetical protein [Polyangiaceae bacterium]